MSQANIIVAKAIEAAREELQNRNTPEAMIVAVEEVFGNAEEVLTEKVEKGLTLKGIFSTVENIHSLGIQSYNDNPQNYSQAFIDETIEYSASIAIESPAFNGLDADTILDMYENDQELRFMTVCNVLNSECRNYGRVLSLAIVSELLGK